MGNKVTIYDIAEKTNVSAVTVHRALSNKGRISEKTKKLILETAESMGYEANPAAQGLRRTQIKIGAVLYCPVDEYVDDIIEGINYCSKRLTKYNVVTNVKKIAYTNSADCLKLTVRQIKSFSDDGYDGIILFVSSMSDEIEELLTLVKDLSEKITFATVANDILGDLKALHIGINAFTAGRMAAEMLEFSCKNNCVSLLTASKASPINLDYINGFINYSNNKIFSDILIYEHYDNKEKVVEVTKKMLNDNPNIKGIYMTTASSSIACKCIRDLGKSDISIITTDLLSDTPELLKQKIADAAIFQNPFKQGKLVLDSLYRFLISKKANKVKLLPPHILLSSNVDSYVFKE